MGIDRPGGTDGPVEDADKPPPPERPPGPPPDRPGQPGFPSRLESRAAAREAQEARAAELERRRTAAPENGTEPSEAPDKEATEASPTEPAGEQRYDQKGQKKTKAADEIRKTGSETGTGLGERDAGRPEPETAEEPQPNEFEAQPGAAETGELSPEPDAEQPGSDQNEDEEAEPLSGEANFDEPDPPAEAQAAEDSPDPQDDEPAADQASRPDVPGEDQRARDSGNQDAGETPPQPPDDRVQPESRDHPQPSQQDGHPADTGAAGPEAAAGQILQADRQPGRQHQGLQDEPRPVPAEQPEDTPEVQPPAEGDMQRTAAGQFTPAEAPDQSDAPVSKIAEPVSQEEGSTQLASPVVDASERNIGSQAEIRSRDAELQRESSAITGRPNETKSQQDLGKEIAELAENKIHAEINEALDKVNPKFDMARSAYSENCTGVVQANELRRRGDDVEAGPLEKQLRTDAGGPGGRSLSTIEKAWGGKFVPGTKAEIEEAFKQPGSRGIVYIAWSGPGGGAHVFNVENVGGKVRYVDGQPTPPIRDASRYFALGSATKYLRVDDRPTPPSGRIDPYLEP